jgi:hypothetical protein
MGGVDMTMADDGHTPIHFYSSDCERVRWWEVRRCLPPTDPTVGVKFNRKKHSEAHKEMKPEVLADSAYPYGPDYVGRV